MKYVDGYVSAVPTANKEQFNKQTGIVAAVFKEYGALAMVGCWGANVPEGEVTSFPRAVKCKSEETVCLG